MHKIEVLIKNVSFFTSSGLNLSGQVYLPKNLSASQAYPAIVLCQGLSGVKNKVLPTIASAFAMQGYITLAFDYRGFGESQGDKTHLFPLERVEDILSATEFMRSYSNVDPERIGLYGLSYGAAGSLYATGLDKKIKCVVAVSGAVDGEDFMRALRTTDQWIAFKYLMAQDRRTRETTGKSTLIPITDIVPFPPNFWKKYNKLDNKNESESMPEVPMFTVESAEAMSQFYLSSILDQISPRPTLIIHGEVDNVIAIEDVLKIFNGLKTKKDFICMEKCDHLDLDSGPGLQKQIEHALHWFKQYI